MSPNPHEIPSAVWFPDEKTVTNSHIFQWMQEKGMRHYDEFRRWSVTDREDFWQTVVTKLTILFDKQYTQVVDLSKGVANAKWFPDARLNIVNSCFQADRKNIAIISPAENGSLQKITYEELEQLTHQVANSILNQLNPGERIALIMPMHATSIAIYLGIIQAGCSVIAIPESFSLDEIMTRIKIGKTKMVITQDFILREGKRLPLYEKFKNDALPLTVVYSAEKNLSCTLRQSDLPWDNFLSSNHHFTAVSCKGETYTTILFSSGTTGEPKAIPWTHLTPIKCASDAYFHQDVHEKDILCWPTSLGWMMGSWLIYASLLNKATIALYNDNPNTKAFGQFVQDARVTMLGVVPTLVKSWRLSSCMEQFDWQNIKCFSSTGECSNSQDMEYLMSLAHNRPVIEYCGGTEIGGAYITGTLLQPCIPGTFTTSALGLDFVILDENGKPTDNGEVALIPPSIGLADELLNKNYYEVYYADMPTSPRGETLRRHGDQVERLASGCYRLLGRLDDTMNLGGIKVSSFEIETVIQAHESVVESAAIAVHPEGGGPSELVIFVVPHPENNKSLTELQNEMQQLIKKNLNPLFKIKEIMMINQLPRTASNKIMRRVLRDDYGK